MGCAKDNPNYNKGEKPLPVGDGGFLDLSDLAITYKETPEIVLNAQTKAGSSVVEASDDYKIVVTLENNTTLVYNYNYGDLKKLTEPISLSPGLYTVEAMSPQNSDLGTWDAPTYYVKKEGVLIEKGKLTTVTDLVCVLSNIRTTVEYSADLTSLFKPDDAANPDNNLVTSIVLGNTRMDYTRTKVEGGNSAYFTAVDRVNDLTINLSGIYNTALQGETPNYVKIEDWQQIIPNVKAGQWRKVFLKVEHEAEGNVEIQLIVETWVYDEQIDIDVKSFALNSEGEVELDDPENEITDPLSPIVTLVGKDINDTYIIDANIFDFDNMTCNDKIVAKATPTSGSEIESIVVKMDSPNDVFQEKVSLYPVNDFPTYVSLVENNRDNSITATVSDDGMFRLGDSDNINTAKIVVLDNLGRESYTLLTMDVDMSGRPPVNPTPPTIEWRGGIDFNETHDVPGNPPLQVVLDISSYVGISGFVVEISGTALPATELESIGLASVMDLINPATPDMAGALSGLGFPVGSEIKGKKAVVFDITQFMPTLAGVAENGATADFKLTVTDSYGSETKTLKLIVAK